MDGFFRPRKEQLERIKPFFPKSRGVSRVDESKVLSGIIIYAHVTALRSRGCPSRLWTLQNPYDRCRRWWEMGVFKFLFSELSPSDDTEAEAGAAPEAGANLPSHCGGNHIAAIAHMGGQGGAIGLDVVGAQHLAIRRHRHKGLQVSFHTGGLAPPLGIHGRVKGQGLAGTHHRLHDLPCGRPVFRSARGGSEPRRGATRTCADLLNSPVAALHPQGQTQGRPRCCNSACRWAGDRR